MVFYSFYIIIKYHTGNLSASKTVEKTERLLEVIFVWLDPTTTVIGVEEFFEFEIEDCPPMKGYIDLIEYDVEGTATMADLKIAARKSTASQTDQNLQLTCHSLGAMAFGFDPERLNLGLDVLTKIKNPELMRLVANRINEDRRRFVKLVRHI